jgi:hypothetical protein
MRRARRCRRAYVPPPHLILKSACPTSKFEQGKRRSSFKAKFEVCSLKFGAGGAAKFPGGHRSRVTPVPIPNTEVKPATADGTAWVTVWESRSLPGLFLEGRISSDAAFFFVRIAPHTRRRGPASDIEADADSAKLPVRSPRAGLEALVQGGNAIDAALTAAVTQVAVTAGAPIS